MIPMPPIPIKSIAEIVRIKVYWWAIEFRWAQDEPVVMGPYDAKNLAQKEFQAAAAAVGFGRNGYIVLRAPSKTEAIIEACRLRRGFWEDPANGQV